MGVTWAQLAAGLRNVREFQRKMNWPPCTRRPIRGSCPSETKETLPTCIVSELHPQHNATEVLILRLFGLGILVAIRHPITKVGKLDALRATAAIQTRAESA